MLGWITYKYYYETDELPNPRKIRLKVAFWAAFSHSKYFFSWVGIDFM